MIFELKEKKNKFLEETYEEAMTHLDKFFGIRWKFDRPNVFLVNSRDEINALRRKETDRWQIAWADGRDIYLLKGNKYKTESSYTYSQKRFEKTLRHELAHLYFYAVAGKCDFRQYIWFQEGVAELASKCVNPSKMENKFSNFLDHYSTWSVDAYQESGVAVMLLATKRGWDNMIKLIKSLKNIKSQKDFNNEFKKIYGQNPTYTFFNKLLKEDGSPAHKLSGSPATSSK